VWTTVPPQSPGLLQANAVAPRRIDLVWNDVFGETGFWIERSTNRTRWAIVGNAATGSTDFVDTAVVPNASYYYRVQAYNSAGASSASPVVRVRTPRIRVVHGRHGRAAPKIKAHPAALRASAPTQASSLSRPQSAAASLPGSFGTATTASAMALHVRTVDDVLLGWPDDRQDHSCV
jgi:hypothetical protein